MSLALAKLSYLKSYFQAIAIGPNHHVDIQGFVFGEKEVIESLNKSELEPAFLWVQWYESPFPFADNLSDNVQLVKHVKLSFMVPTSRTTWQEHEDAYDFCESVIKQIYAKMFLDKRNLVIVVKAENFKGGPIEKTKFGSTEYTGCALEFDFIDNTGLIYDPAKWTP